MTTLTREQEIIKQAVLREVTRLLAENNPQGLQLLKPAQVLQMLSISPRMLYDLRTSGALPAKKIASCYRYAYTDVLNLLKKNSAKPTTSKKTK
jgi:hypothetical protein